MFVHQLAVKGQGRKKSGDGSGAAMIISVTCYMLLCACIVIQQGQYKYWACKYVFWYKLEGYYSVQIK